MQPTNVPAAVSRSAAPAADGLGIDGLGPERVHADGKGVCGSSQSESLGESVDRSAIGVVVPDEAAIDAQRARNRVDPGGDMSASRPFDDARGEAVSHCWYLVWTKPRQGRRIRRWPSCSVRVIVLLPAADPPPENPQARCAIRAGADVPALPLRAPGRWHRQPELESDPIDHRRAADDLFWGPTGPGRRRIGGSAARA